MTRKIQTNGIFFGRILVVVLFVLCIFAPEFKRVPHFYTWILSLFGIFALLDRKFVYSITFFDRKNMLYWLFLFACLIVLMLPPIINNTNDFSYLNILFGIGLCSLRGILLLYICYVKNRKKMLDEYCRNFLLACDLYVFFTLFFIVAPDFKEFWLNNVIANTYVSDYRYYEFRYSLNGFAGFSAASILAFSCVLCGYMLVRNTRMKKILILQFIISTVGCLFYGRVAIIGVALGLVIITFGKKDIKRAFGILSVFIFVASCLLLLLNYLAEINESFFYWRKWAFAIIQQFFSGTGITDYSFTHLFQDMYFIPSPETLLLGDGYYVDPITGKYYMGTDSGYMRLVLFAGIIGVISAFGLWLYTLFGTYKKQSQRVEKLFVIMVFLLWLVLEAKGETYHRMLMLFYPFFLVKRNQKNFQAERSLKWKY